jgi:hypothetical protein
LRSRFETRQNDTGWRTYRGGAVGHIDQNYSHGANFTSISDANGPQYLRVCAQINIDTQYRRRSIVIAISDCDSLSYRAVFSYNRFAVYEYTPEVPNTQASPDHARFRDADSNYGFDSAEYEPIQNQ